MLQKQMFKVLAPMDKKDGGTWWLRCGGGFRNKDNSLNLYIDALPTSHKEGPLKLQVRELTEEDLRERDERKASYAARGTLGSSAATGASATGTPF